MFRLRRVLNLVTAWQQPLWRCYSRMRRSTVDGSVIMNGRPLIRCVRGGTLVIGVHVRRGDYKTYRGGQYYFKDDTYLRIALEALQSSHMHSRDIVIVGFSNEKLDWNPSLDGCRVSTPIGEWWEDFIALSTCDLIIGPPSTFSAAASLAGNVLWYQIKDRNSRYDPAMAGTYLDSGVRV